ncbi:MAG: hypothetical protein ACREIF_06240 [Chthoniobacterales bacterium]
MQKGSPIEAEPFDWTAANHPLGQLLPAMRLGSSTNRIAEMLQSQATSSEVIPGPIDEQPAYVHGYRIFRKRPDEDNVQFVATYTNVLNASGIPIARFRMGEFQPADLSLCQFSLHAPFRLKSLATSTMDAGQNEIGKTGSTRRTGPG